MYYVLQTFEYHKINSSPHHNRRRQYHKALFTALPHTVPYRAQSPAALPLAPLTGSLSATRPPALV